MSKNTQTSRYSKSDLKSKQSKAVKKTGRRYSPSEKKAILNASKSKTYKELFEEYGVYPETVRRWQKRIKNVNNEAKEMVDNSYSGNHPQWKKVLEIWKTQPGLGPAQICNQMKREKIRITPATVRLIMEENGYTPPKTVFKEVKTCRYEAVRPLELVHMDFKHFYINKQKVYLLLLQDDYSRFLMGHKLTNSENIAAVISTFEEGINRYGRMQTVITDAGSAFYCWNGINKFQRLIAEEYGVDHIKAGSPRSNGKVESVNKQIGKELLRIKRFSSIEEADEAIEEWIHFYNFTRTHMGLPEATVPADRFLPGWNIDRTQTQTSTTLSDQLKDITNNGGNDIWLDILRLAVNKLK